MCSCPCCENDIKLIEPLVCQCNTKTCHKCKKRKGERKKALQAEGIIIPNGLIRITE